jgi:phosphoribosylformylglycinamidine synthase
LKLETGQPPIVDLERELQTGKLILRLRDLNLLQAAHDLSDGGLAIAAAEMAIMGKVGIILSGVSLAWLFGEDQGRYLISCWPEEEAEILNIAKKMSVPAIKVGLIEGELFHIGDKSIKITELSSLYELGLISIFE